MRYYLFLFLILPFYSFSQTYYLLQKTQGTNTSLRGLSVVNDSVAWVSGSNGAIGKTKDGGSSWEWFKVKGYEKLDFRDIEAFDDKRAVVVNAGSPAYILKTDDGGKTWKETYKNLDSAIFLDGMDFWNPSTGIIFGDPIKNKMQLLKTTNGGASWTDISAKLPFNMADGEAGFAASGTSIKTMGDGKVWIATGGTVSNIYVSDNYGADWEVYKCPIWQGENSTGPFSIDFINDKNGIVVGGNYVKDKEKTNNVLLTKDGGKTWNKPVKSVGGYRSGVMYLTDQVCFATGTSGTDVSKDGGLNWYTISEISFNAIKKAKNGNLILLAGSNGNIYTLKVE